MEGLTKRYFWVINLALLAVLAYLSARVVNNILAGEIAALKTKPAAVARAGSADKGRTVSKGDWASAINNRNLFNSDPPEELPDSGIVLESDAGPDDGEWPRPGMECKKSESSIGLTATMVAEPAEWSMAVVDDGEAPDARLIKEKQRVADFIVASIQRDRIVLTKGGSAYECVELGQKKGRAKPKSRFKADRGASTNRSKLKDGIKKTGKNQYEIDRDMLNEQLEDLNALSRQARVIPHYRDGKPQGFKIVGVRPGSLYSHIGVRSGDVIKSVNSEEITSPNKALELYEKLKNSDNVTVDVERRGRKVTLDYQIK